MKRRRALLGSNLLRDKSTATHQDDGHGVGNDLPHAVVLLYHRMIDCHMPEKPIINSGKYTLVTQEICPKGFEDVQLKNIE